MVGDAALLLALRRHRAKTRHVARLALGAVGMSAFALTATLLLPWNPVAALLLALLAWAVISAGLYFLLRLTGLFLRSDRLFSKAA